MKCIKCSMSINEVPEDACRDECLCDECHELESEIREYMELHNADEVGINNQWTIEDAEYFLLLSDKYLTF